MILHEAKLPPRKGYVERVNPNTGEHYYHKVYTKVGTIHRRIVIDNSQEFIRPARSINIYVTLVAGGDRLWNCGKNSSIVSEKVYIEYGKKIPITIGQPGEPTSFGDIIAAYEYDEKSKGLTVDGITYGLGETNEHPATQGVCIIEYDETIVE